jgi:hypothetical protein
LEINGSKAKKHQLRTVGEHELCIHTHVNELSFTILITTHVLQHVVRVDLRPTIIGA